MSAEAIFCTMHAHSTRAPVVTAVWMVCTIVFAFVVDAQRLQICSRWRRTCRSSVHGSPLLGCSLRRILHHRQTRNSYVCACASYVGAHARIPTRQSQCRAGVICVHTNWRQLRNPSGAGGTLLALRTLLETIVNPGSTAAFTVGLHYSLIFH